EPWKKALSSLLIPEGPQCWVAMHRPDTVLIVSGKDIDPLVEESQIFEISLSWEHNNYMLRYPFLNSDRHAITGTELKELIMKKFPNGSYEVSPQVTKLLNEANE
ncbi:MAG: hypothetical protein AAF583_15255, partial [Pseudomonadota bacterium]